EVARAGVVIQQRDDLVANRGIVGRLPGHPRRTLACIVIEGRLEDLADTLMLFGRHGAAASSRNSHARASVQRRLSVAGEMTSAASSSADCPVPIRCGIRLQPDGSA